MADVCAIPLIDISEPTENVLWEVEELVRRFGDRCVFIGAYGRLQELTAHESDELMQRLSTFLDGRQVLGYTSDAPGRKRFVERSGPPWSGTSADPCRSARARTSLSTAPGTGRAERPRS